MLSVTGIYGFFFEEIIDKILVRYIKSSLQLNSLCTRWNCPVNKCKWTTTIASKIKQLSTMFRCTLQNGVTTTFRWTLQNGVTTNKTIIEILDWLLELNRRFLDLSWVIYKWIWGLIYNRRRVDVSFVGIVY